MSKYKLVLFDLDGTLVNSDELVINCYTKLFEKFGNVNNTTKEQMYYFSGPSTASTMQKQFPQMDTDFMVEEFNKLSQIEYKTSVTLYPGALKTVELVKAMGYRVGVITNKHRVECEYCYKCLQIEDLFENTVNCQDVENVKPAPDSVYKSMEYFKIDNKDEVIYIGDNPSDYYTAKNAGIDSIIVTWGPRKVDPNIHPTYFAKNFDEIIEILRG